MDGKNRIVKDILESVEKNMGTGKNLSLEALEAHTGYSRFYLNRIFAEETRLYHSPLYYGAEADGGGQKAGGDGQDDRGDIRRSGLSVSAGLYTGIPAGLRMHAVYLPGTEAFHASS